MGCVPYAGFFENYATIRLTVSPAAPRDYKVIINGEKCPITSKAVYLVPPGKVRVTVTRAGKPPCAWAGTVSRAKERAVGCRL
jgi:hypothetical protein